jgi:N-methylhydantoinase B
LNDIRFDGRTYPYVPPVTVPERVAARIHTETEAVSPTDFEVLRHALWNLNLEHGQTIIRTSGSPVVVNSHDFNPVLMDEWGDHVYFGPWLQYLTAAASSAVKWTMENRDPNPGIQPGSMFMTNDPWIGATHQSDLAVIAPVFWDGKIFAWVGNSLHHVDLGGTAPGGFNPVAENVFWESGVIPPVRIVENGEIRTDLEEEFIRRSRMPEIAAVDLRAQIAGCNVAVARIHRLLEKHGPAAIKGVMKKIQDDSESAIVRWIDTVPDGEWRAEAFLEASAPGDRKVYRNCLVLKKTEGRLEFSSEGTDAQVGALGCTLPAWSGAISAMVNSQLLFDQLFAIGGAQRRITFNAEPGTLTSALHPAPLSLAVLTLDQCIALAAQCISKMAACSTDPAMRREIQSSMGSSTFPIDAIAGVDAEGRPFASLLMDPVGAGMAAWSWRDGLDVGGWPWDPQVEMPNVEETESFYPVLYLWRKVTVDSGGAGEFRGGNSMDVAVIPHGVDGITHHMASSAHHSIPLSPLFGGYPSNNNRFIMMRDSNAQELLAAGRVPAPESLDGLEDEIEPKAFGIPQSQDDVFLLTWCGAGGLGDPINRDPSAVLEDVRKQMVSSGAARALYGVVIEDGAVDSVATDALRTSIREARRDWDGPSEVSRAHPDSESVLEAGPGLEIRKHEGTASIACGRCDAILSDLAGNWKNGARSRQVSIQDGNPGTPDPSRLIDADVVMHQFACPGCLTLLDNEVRLRGDAPLWDLRISEGVI